MGKPDVQDSILLHGTDERDEAEHLRQTQEGSETCETR